jgi:DNA polymerase
MALDLDDRQRAMLQEMGVRVWLPGTMFEPLATQPAPSAADSETSIQLRRFGVATAPLRPATPTSAPSPAATRAARPAGGIEVDTLGWDALAQTAAACQACGLCAGRKQSTLSVPQPAVQAHWMVVGDPPDEDEDRLGTPFVEQAGLLLDNMLKAVGARRGGVGSEGVYLSNIVKCRPPLGRLPQAAELAQCAAYLRREVALVQPRVILAMGRFAVPAMLADHPMEAALPLGKQRGTVYRFAGIPVVVTYHPQVLLRAGADKAKAWADLCLAVQVLEGSAPSLQSPP